MNTGLASAEHRSRAHRPAVPVGGTLVLTLMTGCGEPVSPGASLSILTQPSQAVVGRALSPNLEVEVSEGTGNPAAGVVSVALDANPCGWVLGGTSTASLIGGRAVFAGLSFEKAAANQVLKVGYEGISSATDPIDVTAIAQDGRLEQDNTLCLKRDRQGDAESLAFVPEDDAFWIADDDRPGIFQIDRPTGQYISRLSADSILEALPSARECDDGDGDPTTSCSYISELEHVVYDQRRQRLYAINTVNNADADPVEDKAAIFVFRRGACRGCFTPESWQPLPGDYHSGPMALIDGEIHAALGGRIYRYDVDGNRILTVTEANDSVPPVIEISGVITAFHQEGTNVWILNHSNVIELDRATGGELARYALDEFGVSKPRGIQVVGGGVYVLDGDQPNALYVFHPTR